MNIKNINLNRLIGGLEQVGQLDSVDFKFNYAVGRNIEKMATLGKSYSKSLSALVNKHVQMDDKGSPVTIGNEYDFKTKKDRETYIKSKTDLDEIENEVDLWLLKTSDLEKIKGLKAVTLFMLGDIIVDDLNLDDGNSEGNSVPKKDTAEVHKT